MDTARLLLEKARKQAGPVWIVIVIGFALAFPAAALSGLLSYHVLIFISSLLLLLKSADFLVKGSSRLARVFGIPTLIIGITVVAFGTSLPELTVSALANMVGSSGLSIGNIIGSNISNICLVLGVAAIIAPIKVRRHVFSFDVPFLLFVTILLPVISIRMFFDMAAGEYVIGMVDGLILLGLFVFFMYSQVKQSSEHHLKRLAVPRSRAGKEKRKSRILGYVTMLVAGLTGVIISAGLLVESGRGIARIFGIPEIIIGLTMVAVGTSLPELATNVMAALRKKLDLAVGNVIGSNVFNILLVLGTSAALKPIEIINTSAVLYDIPIMIGLTIVFVILMRSGHVISRLNGITLFALYALYIAYLFTRMV